MTLRELVVNGVTLCQGFAVCMSQVPFCRPLSRALYHTSRESFTLMCYTHCLTASIPEVPG